LRHNTANAGSPLHEMDFDSHVSKIERGLNASDSAADDQYVFQVKTPYLNDFRFKNMTKNKK
jgi:hypothetical protein